MGTHIVQPGESLWSIAQKYNLSAQVLVQTNQIQTPNSLLPGALLSIPEQRLTVQNNALPLTLSSPRSAQTTHVVIHFISNAADQPRDPYNLQAIQNLFITQNRSVHYLIGRNGDVYQLVDETRMAYHTDKGALTEFPEYTDQLNEVSIGIALLAIGSRDEMLPSMAGQTYDTIPPNDIGATHVQYRSLNHLLSEIFQRNPAIVRDRQHVIGGDEYDPTSRTDPGKLFDWSQLKVIGQTVHIVQNGETLWMIAQKYGISVDELADWNNLSATRFLYKGEHILIPTRHESQGSLYIVQAGDSLWGIAHTFDISVETLADANHLNPGALLQIGHKLVIPN